MKRFSFVRITITNFYHKNPPTAEWLSGLDPITKSNFLRDYGTAQATIQSGISTGSAKSTETAWKQWEKIILEMALDPFFETFQDKVPLLQVFAHRVRPGKLAAHGNPIRARSTEVYLRFVSQTFLGMGASSTNDI